ncbi:MAG TPA: response regulator [Patescibacteria group bacterium]|nr:response regulator [Patescibacteria group bacterium]
MKKILIIEDNAQYAAILSKKLTIEGYEVVRAPDGEEGLKLVENDGISLILLDLLMPKVDGIEFYHKLREKLKDNVPVIVLTNVAEATGYDPNLKDVLIKSNVSLEEVVKRVKAAIGD